MGEDQTPFLGLILFLSGRTDLFNSDSRHLLVFYQIRDIDCDEFFGDRRSHYFGCRSLSYLLSVRMRLDEVDDGPKSRFFSTRVLEVTDQRIKTMAEIIQSVRIIKMYCWETAFSRKICSIRRLALAD